MARVITAAGKDLGDVRDPYLLWYYRSTGAAVDGVTQLQPVPGVDLDRLLPEVVDGDSAEHEHPGTGDLGETVEHTADGTSAEISNDPAGTSLDLGK